MAGSAVSVVRPLYGTHHPTGCAELRRPWVSATGTAGRHRREEPASRHPLYDQRLLL